MGGRGDCDDVDVLIFDDFADVLFVLGGLALGALGAAHGLADDVGIGVADGGDDAVIFAGEAADVFLAAAADA